jgi:ABC-type polysaccharide/polyol phosphate transport system ATPase subunit
VAEQGGARVEALQAELSRAIELKIRLQEALDVTDADRAELRREVRILDARLCQLHDELAFSHSSQTDLHNELGAVHAERARLKAALNAALTAGVGEVLAQPQEVAQRGAEEESTEVPRTTEGSAEGAATAAKPEEATDAVAAEEEPVEEEEESESVPVRLRAAPAAIAVEVRDLHKRFHIPSHQMETLKERLLHPLRSRHGEELLALDGVSFEVGEGEFLGIAGANGSGKSTLLKILASVYAADSGSVRVAGRVAPFIELGVGLNPELAAFDNVVMSGVMMGLEPDVARTLYPEIIEFAGLEAYTKVKLKNYSSGMRVRLAFAVMAQVDADILLVDEVLAVGDAEFRAKCLDRLHRLRDEGKTIIFVTHAMDVMTEQCDRALLLEGAHIVHEGDPADVAERYLNPEPDRQDDADVTLTVVEQ